MAGCPPQGAGPVRGGSVTAYAAFHAMVSALNYPMFVVTTAAGGQRAGCLVGFTTQTGISPPRFLVGLSDKNHTYRVAKRAPALVVHALRQEQHDLAELFGTETGDEVDKFDRCAWTPGPEGIPVLDECAGWFAGRVLERVPFTDHVGHVVEPYDGRFDHDGPLLTFRDVQDLEPGHEA